MHRAYLKIGELPVTARVHQEFGWKLGGASGMEARAEAGMEAGVDGQLSER